MIVEPDDNTCETYTSEERCLADPSPLSNKEAKCYWDSIDHSCHFRNANNDMTRIVVASIIAALLTSPLAFLMEWATMNILAGTPNDESARVLPTTDDDAEAGVGLSDAAFVSSVDEEFDHCMLQLLKHRDKLKEKQKRKLDGTYVTGNIVLHVSC